MSAWAVCVVCSLLAAQEQGGADAGAAFLSKKDLPAAAKAAHSHIEDLSSFYSFNGIKCTETGCRALIHVIEEVIELEPGLGVRRLRMKAGRLMCGIVALVAVGLLAGPAPAQEEDSSVAPRAVLFKEDLAAAIEANRSRVSDLSVSYSHKPVAGGTKP